MKQYERKASFIGGFIHDDKCYEHWIFCSEDDRIECVEMETNTIVLTYTANCYVKDMDGNHLGTWHTTGKNMQWYFKSFTGKEYHFGTDLLKAELNLSDMYLRGEVV